ncbi:Leucyl aminopeptidase (aminopeptidase T) [Anaerocolumna jejuensis DSM 15929]|uniref:Leucyl aminopeptidase (Aminopeptidase T) n=1 Tax=Anaerocolumna jejuensis DSM 15929 TaxID=1121322 RepID=A0A1M6JEZ0_9FIRM|nr:aminopeptidase [Anaerocolumna jejuensis]SHJ45205.1 Leucyl aminopeptidase (aminopeptidase T) [Anaerocolumna jejuensis DSM 15929]
MDSELIKKIVKSSGVREGELILVQLWGEDSDITIMHDFAVAVAELGASPLELQQSRSHNRNIFSAAKEACFPERYYSIFEKVDAVLDVFTYQPVVLNYEISKEQMNYYRNYMRKLFETLMKKKRFTQIRIPTAENARESDLDIEDYIKRMTKAYDIDYIKLSEICEKKIAELKAAREILLHTGDNCSLKLVMGDRNWIADCGDGDWPCGEVYIAPIEEKTAGKVFYNKLFIENTGVFEKVILTVEEGIVISSNQEKVNDFIKNCAKESLTVCELGFGCNENITGLCGYAVLDEKMADSFHIAIGDNRMFGGKNKADLHMDFVGIAEIEIIN